MNSMDYIFIFIVGWNVVALSSNDQNDAELAQITTWLLLVMVGTRIYLDF